MRSKPNLLTKLFLIFTITGTIEGCGLRFGHGAIFCSMGSIKINQFKTSLCTHACVDAWLECSNNVCSPRLSPDSEDVIEDLKPNFPVGLYITVDLRAEDYLKWRSRRQNTVKAITDLMTAKNLSFVQFNELHWHPDFKNTDRRNYLDLVEDISIEAHKRQWNVGMRIEVRGTSFAAKYDFEDLNKFVDWFVLTPRKKEEAVNGKFFLGPAFPLTSNTSEGGSYKYAIDYVLNYTKSECILVQIEGGGKRYLALEAGVDPGPGSLAQLDDNYIPYKEICRRIIDENCPQFWDESASLPYTVCGTEYFSYENQTSIRLKIDLLKSYNVAGVQYHWTTHDDDVGICRLGPMPQLTAMQGIQNRR